MGCYKKNEALQVNYIALKKTTGLTDVKMRVYNPADVLINEYTMVEVAASSGDAALGLYRKSFTPTTDGQYRVRIESIVNGDDISKIFEIGNYKLDDVKDQTQDIEDKTDIIDGNVDQALLDIAAAKIVIDATKVVVDATKVVVDNIDLQINAGGYIL